MGWTIPEDRTGEVNSPDRSSDLRSLIVLIALWVSVGLGWSRKVIFEDAVYVPSGTCVGLYKSVPQRVSRALGAEPSASCFCGQNNYFSGSPVYLAVEGNTPEGLLSTLLHVHSHTIGPFLFIRG